MEPKQKVIFKSIDGLSLVGELNKPDGSPEGVCVLCHPHPLYGGDMHTSVIKAFWKHLPQSGLLTFRFNFRGVGVSEGRHEEGVGETQDILGALAFLVKQGYRDTPFFLIGYSFGAYVIHRLGPLPDPVKGVCLISPPVLKIPFDFSSTTSVPHLIMAGDADAYCNLSILRSKLENSGREVTLIPFAGTDHFWAEKEINLVKNFLSWHKTIRKGVFRPP